MGSVTALERRIYAMADVDRYLGLPGGTARRWIDGYARGTKTYPPVIRPSTTGDEGVTWGEFVETRLLAGFRHRGVSLQRLRPAVERLREELGHPYPLAARPTLLDVEGRDLVMRVQQEADLDKGLSLVVIRSGQLILSPSAQAFVDQAQYDDGVVSELLLGGDTVRANPLRATGRPAVRSVPSEVLAEGFRAGESAGSLADLYDLTLDEVEAALRYEMQAASTAAA